MGNSYSNATNVGVPWGMLLTARLVAFCLGPERRPLALAGSRGGET